MPRNKRIHLEVSDDDDDDVVAYLAFRDHPGSSAVVVKKNVRLRDLIGNYVGPDLFFDFDENNVLVGVEILD